ncbi:hypothetical protein IIB34_05060 [PVC group bacterium]|nr:hypothetical protein [PVC group bacterium]
MPVLLGRETGWPALPVFVGREMGRQKIGRETPGRDRNAARLTGTEDSAP